MKLNLNEENLDSKDMKISNHKIFNYTGRALILYKVKIKSDKISVIDEKHKFLTMILPSK